jgi:hypothetical protein
MSSPREAAARLDAPTRTTSGNAGPLASALGGSLSLLMEAAMAPFRDDLAMVTETTRGLMALRADVDALDGRVTAIEEDGWSNGLERRSRGVPLGCPGTSPATFPPLRIFC